MGREGGEAGGGVVSSHLTSHIHTYTYLHRLHQPGLGHIHVDGENPLLRQTGEIGDGGARLGGGGGACRCGQVWTCVGRCRRVSQVPFKPRAPAVSRRPYPPPPLPSPLPYLPVSNSGSAYL